MIGLEVQRVSIWIQLMPHHLLAPPSPCLWPVNQSQRVILEDVLSQRHIESGGVRKEEACRRSSEWGSRSASFCQVFPCLWSFLLPPKHGGQSCSHYPSHLRWWEGLRCEERRQGKESWMWNWEMKRGNVRQLFLHVTSKSWKIIYCYCMKYAVVIKPLYTVYTVSVR